VYGGGVWRWCGLLGHGRRGRETQDGVWEGIAGVNNGSINETPSLGRRSQHLGSVDASGAVRDAPRVKFRAEPYLSITP
jgi:hypothetical protein